MIDYPTGLKNSVLCVVPEREVSLEVLRRNLFRELAKVRQIDLDKTHAEQRKRLLREEIESGLKAATQASLFGVQEPSEQQIRALMRILLTEVHREVQKMRLETLRKLRMYTVQSDCKRQYLLGQFGFPIGKKCGLCDSCQADLNFTRERAERAPEEAEYPDVIHSFERAKEGKDWDKIDDLLDATGKRGLQTSILAMAETHLESVPDNLGCRLIAGMLRSQRSDEKERSRGFEHLMQGGVAADEEYRDREMTRKFYTEARRLDPKASLPLIDRADGVFDNREEYDFIYKEFRRWLPQDGCTQRLGALLCGAKIATIAAKLCTKENDAFISSILA
jgi:hypothetical protein